MRNIYGFSPKTQAIIIISVLIFLSRLPFLTNGFGTDSDAWRVANAARLISTTGEYAASRSPGYPLQEMMYSLIWKFGGREVAFNTITAFFSVLCFVLFSLYLFNLKSKDFLLGGITLVFTTVIYINSTDSMDYIWALAFILSSFYFVSRGMPLLAGVGLGFAIGCRITSGAMFIPLSLMLVHYHSKVKLLYLIRFLLPTLLIGTFSYIPVILKYGFSFFTFYDYYPPIIHIIYVIIMVWGVIGSAAILFSVIEILFLRSHSKQTSIPAEKLLIIAWVSGILIYIIAFLRLPHESGYLVPVMPFTILLLGRFLNRRSFITVCTIIILSSFIISIQKDGNYLRGPIFCDYVSRKEREHLVEKVILLNKDSEEKRVVVSGWYLPIIKVKLDSNTNRLIKYVELLKLSELFYYSGSGYKIYYLPEILEYNLRANNVDLNKEGGKILTGD